MDDKQLISIVTPCLNRVDFVSDAIESVLVQDCPGVEHVVVDGGSTDGTLDILKQYAHLRLILEPDRGMYDAINKGIRLARGTIIGLLNSDDIYEPNIFLDVVEGFQSDPAVEALVGGATVFRGSVKKRQTVRTNLWIEESELWYRLSLGSPVTNAWFFRRDLFNRVGYFDDSYRISSDREFLLRMAIAKVKYAPLRKIVYHYRQHSGSYTFDSRDSRLLERAETRMRTLDEGVRIAEKFLNASEAPREARHYLRRWHTQRTYSLAATALYHHRWALALNTAARGWHYNSMWPLSFLLLGFKRVVRWRVKDEKSEYQR